MSEVRLIVRDATREVYGNRHGSFANAVIGALSADPETIDELEVALERFIAPDEWSYLRGFMRGADDQPYDAGIVIVDLAARLIVCESTYSFAERQGAIRLHDRRGATDIEARYQLAEDWEIINQVDGWRSIAEQRRAERAANPPLDARAVLYGEPLLAFVARECWDVFRDRPLPAERMTWHDKEYGLMRQIHVRWMMTPRDDLRGQTPREVMMERHEFVSRSLWHRQEQWSQTHRCPRGVDAESSAYRFAGFGTHELVVYYDMVRFLLSVCRVSVADEATSRGVTTDWAEQFVAAEVPRLAEHRDQWLDEPEPELSGHVPRQIIENERMRIPEAMGRHEAIIDHDCPLCRMSAEMPGPAFWGLDGCNMDDDFAFDMFHETYEEWQTEQERQAERDRKWKAQEAERERLGVKYPSVWKSSYTAEPSPGDPPVLRLFAIGTHLSELMVDLRESSATGRDELVDHLSRDFGNLGDVAQAAEPAAAEALLEPVVERFCESLDAVAAALPELEPKCSDLQARLRRFGEPVTAQDATDMFGDDIPY